jgi:hypothetical protein
MRACPEGFGDGAPARARIEVVDHVRPVRDGEARSVEADGLRSAADDEHARARAGAQMRHDGTPGVCEVVRSGRHAQRIEPVGQGDEHVAGVRDTHQVAHHPAVRPARRAEPVRRQDALAARG